MTAKLKPPKVGSKIYVDTSWYIDHGEDDVLGGVATVTKVETGISGGEKTYFVTTKEHPGRSYNWEFLAERQAELKKEFGKRKARPDPDYG